MLSQPLWAQGLPEIIRLDLAEPDAPVFSASPKSVRQIKAPFARSECPARQRYEQPCSEGACTRTARQAPQRTWSGGEFIGQPKLGRCVDGSRDDVGPAHLD